MKKSIALLLAMVACASLGAQGTSIQKKIVIGLEQGITMGDPQKVSTIAQNLLFNMVFDRLVSFDPKDLTFHPELALSWKWVSPTVIEFKLRKNVKFHNGSAFTADDVVHTFQRAKSGTTIATKVAGLASIEALDPYTVRMTLTTPNVDWLDTLALPMSSILSKSATEADPVNGGSIGTGAWVIKELKAGDYVTLARNASYWSELPKTETIVLRYIPEDSARLIALQNGEIDLCNYVANTELKYVTDDPNLSLVQFNSTSIEYLAFNSSKAPGNDQNLRLAVAYAINIDDIMTVVAGGLGTKAVSYWGPQTYGYYDGFGPYKQDLALAKKYLALAFPKGGAKLEISVSGTDRTTIAQIIQEQCRQIGLEVAINELEGAALTAATAFKTAQHQAMLYALGWNSAGDDARRPYYTGSNTNKATLTNQRIMDLLDKAATEFDDKARKAMYKEIQQINHDQAYYIPLYFPILNVGIKKNLRGAVWMANKSNDYTYVYIENKK